MGKISRRVFAAAAAFAATGLKAQEDKPRVITSASVPGDPVAPGVSGGTQPEELPFDAPMEFQRMDVKLRAEAFSLRDVKLLDSEFLKAQEINRAYLHDLEVDRLVHTFRLNAGLPSKAEPLGGWEKPDCELRGHFIGHYLSACALMYAATGDEAIRAKGNEVVAVLAKCQTELSDGYLSAFPRELFDRLEARKKVWAPFYTYHKIMAGMLDMHQLCDNQQALTVVKGMADWTDTWTRGIPEDHMQMVLDEEFGGMSEVLYNLAVVTGDEKYVKVGDRFTKKRFCNPLALRRDELRGLHVNTHIPQVIGAARRYEISGDRRFYDVADYFWLEVTGARAYVTGGTSNNEGWLVQPNKLALELKQANDTTECCCAYNMMKLTRKLYQWSADPRYFDYYERTMYNHRLGTIRPDGEMQYYLGIVPGSWRTYSTKFSSFWCCDGTGVEEYAKLADSIYFHDANSVFVNLFIPSELTWKQKGVRLRQETKFPDEASTAIVIEAAPAEAFTLHLRVPSWVSKDITLRVNGKITEATASAGSYVSLARIWKKGDRVEMQMPMSLRFEAMPDDRNLRAVLYGPLVLAGGLGKHGLTDELTVGPLGADLRKHPAEKIPEFTLGTKTLTEWMRKGDAPLTFEAQGVTFRPLHRTSGQRYAIYWRVDEAVNEG
jgi:DUF1680 family protein